MAKWIAFPHCVTVKAGTMVFNTSAAYIFDVVLFKKNLEFLESNNKIVSEKIRSIAQWNRGSKRDRQQIQHDRDRSLPTPVSFSVLGYQKNTLSFVSRIT